MIDVINKAMDMGWRVTSTNGVYRLVPPDGSDITGVCRFISVPLEIESWVRARELGSPDQKKRHSLKAKVQTWFRLEWPSYVKECDADEEYAKKVILQDAQSDFEIDEYDSKDWFDSRE